MDVLSAAHAGGVIHCDIKPENIVCSPDDGIMKPFVIDWGLAAVTGDDAALLFEAHRVCECVVS